jgi:hypothetical protein
MELELGIRLRHLDPGDSLQVALSSLEQIFGKKPVAALVAQAEHLAEEHRCTFSYQHGHEGSVPEFTKDDVF